MKELTDQELTNKIRQVFDGFEDPEADQGWEDLRKKFPEENKKPLFIWWWSAAALVVLSFGIWLLMPGKNIDDQNFANNPKTQTHEKSSEQELIKPEEKLIKAEPIYRSLSNNQFSRSEITKDSTNNEPINKFSVDRSGEAILVTNPSFIMEKHPAVLSNNNVFLPFIADSIANPVKTVIADAPIQKTEPQTITSNITVNTSPLETKLPELKEDKKPAEKSSKDKLGISFYAGSYFNYSEGSDTKLNFGAGISSDVKLSKNLRLSTGVSIAKNSLNYDGGLPSGSNSDKAYNSVAPPNASINPPALTLQTITNYNADLLSLDIPVNIKYLIIPEANKLYISAGLSSGTQINETYVYYYQNYSTASGFSSNQAKGEETKKQFQSFDLARTFNLSFGFSTNLSKTQNITIEPFLKYPLGGLGSENLRFGSSGINLKLNFKQLKHGK